MTTDQMEQAFIGFGSAIIGAVVGGLFVLYATRAQWKRDRRGVSRQAAARVLTPLAHLEGVFATVLSGQEVSATDAAAAFNTFSVATTTEMPFIDDDQVVTQILAHVQLCHPLLAVAATTVAPPGIFEATRRHADAVTEALQAHIRGAPIPPYTPLPQNAAGGLDLNAFLLWPAKG